MSYQGEILLDAGTNELEIVEFQIIVPGQSDASGYYGINVAKVKEIVTVPEIMAYPKAHPAIAGAINLRGSVIALVDLAQWLGMETELTKKSRIIVTEFNGVVTGFIVNAVTRIHRISWNQVVPPPMDVAVSGDGVVTAVVKLEERMILMLDFESILASLNPNVGLNTKIAPAAAGYNREDKTILIADDSGSIRRIIDNALKGAGFKVEAVEDGEKALNFLEQGKANGHLPDLVISDIEMPQIDGLHLLSRIKSTDGLKQLPVIMFSSLGSESNRAKALKLGAQDLISKPDLPRLIEIVDQIFTQVRA